MAIEKNFDPVTSGKYERGRGLVAFKYFGPLKRALELLNFRLNEPSHDILGPLGQYDP